MATANDLRNFGRRQSGVAQDTAARLVKRYPEIPPDVKKRFPSFHSHEQKVKEWVTELIIALRGGQGQ